MYMLLLQKCHRLRTLCNKLPSPPLFCLPSPSGGSSSLLFLPSTCSFSCSFTLFQGLDIQHEGCSHNHYCHEKSISITYSECVFVALIIQHAKCMCPIILSYVACWATLNFSVLPHEHHDFQENIIEHKTCILIFSTTLI